MYVDPVYRSRLVASTAVAVRGPATAVLQLHGTALLSQYGY